MAQGGLPRPSAVHIVSSTKNKGVRELLADVQAAVGVRGDVWVVGAQASWAAGPASEGCDGQVSGDMAPHLKTTSTTHVLQLLLQPCQVSSIATTLAARSASSIMHGAGMAATDKPSRCPAPAERGQELADQRDAPGGAPAQGARRHHRPAAGHHAG